MSTGNSTRVDAAEGYLHCKSVNNYTTYTDLNAGNVKKIPSNALKRIYSINKLAPQDSAGHKSKLNVNATEWIPSKSSPGTAGCGDDLKISENIHKEKTKEMDERGDNNIFKENDFSTNNDNKNKYILQPRALIGSYNFSIRPLIQTKPIYGNPSIMPYTPRRLLIDSNMTKDSDKYKYHPESMKLISPENEVEYKLSPDDIFASEQGKLNAKVSGMVGGLKESKFPCNQNLGLNNQSLPEICKEMTPQHEDKRSDRNANLSYIKDAKKESAPIGKLSQSDEDASSPDYAPSKLFWGKEDSDHDNSESFDASIQEMLATHVGGSHRLNTKSSFNRFYDIPEKPSEMDDEADAVVEYEGTDSESEVTSIIDTITKMKISSKSSNTSAFNKSIQYNYTTPISSIPETFSAVAPVSMININHSFNKENCDDGSDQNIDDLPLVIESEESDWENEYLDVKKNQPMLLTPNFFTKTRSENTCNGALFQEDDFPPL